MNSFLSDFNANPASTDLQNNAGDKSEAAGVSLSGLELNSPSHDDANIIGNSESQDSV